jgi:seryl-tRNA synthetase
MHDIKFIREHPEEFDAGLIRRGLPAGSASLLALDRTLRQAQTDLQDNQTQSNAIAREIGTAKREGKDAAELLRRADEIKTARPELVMREFRAAEALGNELVSIPNLPAADVPDGPDASANVEKGAWGKPGPPHHWDSNTKPLEHDEIGTKLGLMDFQRAAKISGARFTVLSGSLARLERALAGFMLDLHTKEFDYTEVSPPVLVRDAALVGTGQLPKFKADLFRTVAFEQKTIEDAIASRSAHEKVTQEEIRAIFQEYDLLGTKYLIPTAEVPLTNLVAGEILAEDELPKRFTAHTVCFRSEAGAAGKDTRGMIRQHQFYKVELVSIAHPEKSEEEHERMTSCAEEVLKRLGLPFRRMLLCTGDMGFGARKTYDLEVWLPGQNQFREISSCSNCGDFQARRMNTRFRPKDSKGTRFVHTMNGSGLAVGRTLIAILENYQRADGTVEIPEALRHRMGGQEIITPNG